jgi:hypothetical protein
MGAFMTKSVGLIAAFLLGAVTISSAETPEQRQACTDDAFRVCNDAIPDRDRVFRCLLQNSSAISPLCRTALAPYLQNSQPTAQATPKRPAKARAKTSRPGKGPINLNPNAH